MDLANQKKLAEAAQTYFDGKLRTIILDNRRRVRMQGKDDVTRRKRGLSAIPPMKSRAAVDRFVERALIEYHQDPDSISYTAKGVGRPEKDSFSRWLTEAIRYRMDNTFDFFNWHQGSLTAVATDGFECALVYWKKESIPSKVTEYRINMPDGTSQKVDKAVYDANVGAFPEFFEKQDVITKESVCDTWWIDQLEPGKDIVWDPQIPLLDVNLGQFCKVTLKKTIADIKNLSELGILDKVADDVLAKYQRQQAGMYRPSIGSLYLSSQTNDRTVDDPYNVDLEQFNRLDLCCFFFKDKNRWMCQFSLDMQDAVSKVKPVDDVFFGGRRVNRLPVVVGTTKKKLWEEVGCAIPEIISALEDEHSDMKNNLADAAKIQLQGRWRVEPDSDINIDDLLNRRVVTASKGDFEVMETNFQFLDAYRTEDSRTTEINELIPSGVMGATRNVAGKGTNKTLGQTQIGVMASDEKLGVQLMTRNNTFLKKVLWLVAQLEMAFETDEVILKIAGERAGVDVPIAYNAQGKAFVDLSVLDFDVDIQINAGLGSQPRYQKADTVMQLTDWGLSHGLPVNTLFAFQQLSALGGFEKDALLMKQPPPEPKPKTELKLDIKTNMAELFMIDQGIPQFLLQKLMAGEVDVNMKADDNQASMNEARQNGGGAMLPDRTGKVVDGMGKEAMGMSEGGMMNG